MIKINDLDSYFKSFCQSTVLKNLYQIIENIPSIIVITDKEGKIEYVNKKFQELTGYTLADVKGKNLSTLKSGDMSKNDYEDLWLTISNGEEWSGEFHNRKKDGSLYWERTKISPIKDEQGDIVKHIAIKEDITARKKMEAELIKSKARLSLVFNEISDLIFLMKVEKQNKFKVVMVNKAYCDTTGLKEEELIGKLLTDIIPKTENTSIIEMSKRVAENKTEVKFETIANFQDKKIFLETTLIPILDAKRRCSYILGVDHNITIYKNIDKMKSELINTVSHEIKTPLSSLLGFTELLLNKKLKQEKIRKYLEIIHQESNRLKILINDFLNIQHMESAKGKLNKEEFNLIDLINDVIELYSINKSHKLIINRHDQLRITADYNRIKQLLTNLISNAIKYSNKGTQIKIIIQDQENEVIVIIKDQGIGISKIDQDNIFDKFYRIDNEFTRSANGTGLGLAICKGIVQEHNGTIGVNSKRNVGSEFYFTLPK